MVVHPGAEGAMIAAFGAYRAAIGQARTALTTPALILDLPVVRHNIALMAARLPGSVRLRPHAKSHKCAEIARLQIAAGAIGVTTATVWEAIAMVRAGIDDVLIANEVIGQEKIARLAQAAQTAHVTVAVDNLDNARTLSAAAVAAKCEIGVLVDVDIGLDRCGVRGAAAARMLAERIGELSGLRLRGVMGYEGHCALEPDRERRAVAVRTAMERLLAAAESVRAAGLPVEIVSAGGTGTFDITSTAAGVTEIQAGSYVFMDAARAPIVPEFSTGLTVLATVLSRHQTTLVLDCGKKTIGIDFALPRIVGVDATARYVAEEHAVFDVERDSRLEVGDVVELMVGYCPTTINLHDMFHVVEGERVIAIWPVLARGSGRMGLS